MAEQSMRVIPTRLGEREIADDAVISFPHGLIGFEDKRDFVLLRMSDDSPFMLLQSLEDKALGLLVADPFTFIKEYTFKLDNAEKRILDSPDLSALAVLVTVSIPNNQPDKTTLNLSGPIVINSAAKVGIQSPQIDSAFPARLRLVDAK